MTASMPKKGRIARAQASQNTVKRHPTIPFISQSIGPRGGVLGVEYFNLQIDPKATYSEGSQAGVIAASLLVEALRNPVESPIGGPDLYNMMRVIEGAVEASHEVSEAKRGAAHAFITFFADAVIFAAKNGRFDAYFASKTKTNEALIGIEKEEKARRIQRSVAARAAKRAARQKGGAA